MSNWDTIREGLGYGTEREMFLALYAKKSISQLCEMFAVSNYTIRKKLAEHGIPLRGRGGPHGLKIVEMTQEIIDDMTRDGVDATAAKLGVSKFTLFRRKKAFLAAQAAQGTGSPSSPGDAGEEQLLGDSHTLERLQDPPTQEEPPEEQ